MPQRSVAVVVLGDVGRSPRMQYHTTSLASLGADTTVSLVGYAGERCIDAVEHAPNVHQFLLGSPFAKLPRSLFLLWAPLKVLYQIFQLFWILLVTIPRPSAILVQNPPSIPALLAVWVACRLRGARMIIDWHNFGYTVLGHSLKGGEKHPLVKVATAYERTLGRLADGHICVTKAMKKWLERNWDISPTVLYDRPPPFFKTAPPDVTHDLFKRLGKQVPTGPISSSSSSSRSSSSGTLKSGASASSASKKAAGGSKSASQPASAIDNNSNSNCSETVLERTLLTEKVKLADGSVTVRKRADRPAMLISSTSWTPDEDFGILLDALVQLDKAACRSPSDFPDFLVVVTGKGPQRAAYEARIAKLAMKRVAVRTLWLAAADYPLMLGSADAGVCLHTSTSGLDLPMKVVDMFGCGLPVCAVGFACLDELVQHGVNGMVFDNSAQLAEQLQALFRGFPAASASASSSPSADSSSSVAAAAVGGTSALTKLRKGVAKFQSLRWQDNWDANVKGLFV